ncbi:MAG TPA: thioesterase domain-containing protein, partial [Blastocatellia bacterium]|nr:thioesterase domain-containing protein [Blastocatellia bacterium]
TAAKYLPDQYSQGAGERVYATGDLARYRDDGNLTYLGRRDDQVKVRGYRIELGEIESLLESEAGVRQAAVVVNEKGGQKRLIGYVVMSDEQQIEEADMKRRLRSKLPDYMVPARIVLLEQMPLMTNGKLDRRALTALAFTDAVSGESFIPARDIVELKLVQIFEEVLGVRPVGVGDDFFQLGGHSLLAVRVISKIQSVFSKDLPLNALFQETTAEALAMLLRGESDMKSQSCLVTIESRGIKRPFFCVHHAGGNVFGYVALSRNLGADQPFYGLQSKGMDGASAFLDTIEDMAAYYIEQLRTLQPTGPYLLGGFSLGGVIAFEMAQQLRDQGQKVALLALLDTGAPGLEKIDEDQSDAALLAGFAFILAPSIEYLSQLGPDEQLAYILEEAKRANLVPPDFGLSDARHLFEVFKANVRASQTYRPGVYSDRITLFRATEQFREDSQDSTLGWGELTSEGVEIIDLPGDHYSILRKPFVHTLAEKLRESIDRAQESED